MKALFQAGLAREKAKTLLRDGEFAELFAELGWDAPSVAQQKIEIPLREQPVPLRYVAEKRGFVVCVCDIGDEEPSRDFRRAVGKELAKIHYENILIFRGGGRQFWQVSIRPQNRPLRVVTVDWWEKQDPNRLLDKLDGVIFGVAEEGGLNIVDVVTRVRESFIQNAESVTRQFYGQFKKELDEFAEFISGLREIAENADLRKWLAALMLNRLMFCYFIQKKGFLNGDKNYLRNRLKESRAKFGADQFHQAFYRKFLYRLFHEGLGAPPETRKPDFEKMIGKIPYLNGGLFDLVDAEKGMQIPDDQFERVFNFFDQWNWHLDERPNAPGKDINPDVIGYIFEKYINDRADMGAYYTQGDVTGYIARGAILPVVLRRACAECKTAFSGEGDIWKLLRDNPEEYIFAAAQHGCKKSDSEIPEHIRIGLDAKAPKLAQRRKNWNRAAPAEFGLPTETWREVIARRARFRALCNSLKNGECESVEFLLSHNLDIQRFMDDALREYEGSDFIAAVFRALAGREPEKSNQHLRRPLSVLDPACGSGAFLFAALNVLTPLYRQCLNRMEEFVEEDNRRVSRKKGAQKKFPEFRRILAEVRAHPNEEYWIRKSCILNNLHGTDIMPEAVEIAKLRLFLNLAAKAECDLQKPNMGLEPLPDIDFNIRPGNALVGFADMTDFEVHAEKEMYLQKRIAKVRESTRLVEMADIRFREAQKHDNPKEYRDAKSDLATRLDKLDSNLNNYLARVYGKKDGDEIRAWTQSHRPFHWLSNFYGIMSDGGFDAIIGNPPYVEYYPETVGYELSPDEFSMFSVCGNLYAYFMERCLALKNTGAACSMIVPLSGHSTIRMRPLISCFYRAKKQRIWIANLSADAHPSMLFEGVKFRLSVFNSAPAENPEVYATGFTRWLADGRKCLFDTLSYCPLPKSFEEFPHIAKIGSPMHANIIGKILRNKKFLLSGKRTGGHSLWYHNAPVHWIRAHTKPPYFFNKRRGIHPSTQLRELRYESAGKRNAAFAVLVSTTFFLWWLTFSDCYHLNLGEIQNFPYDELDSAELSEIGKIIGKLERDMARHSCRRVYNYKTGRVEYDEFYMKKSKPLIDEIDAILARHYGFTDEELDYIVNYDVKFRTDGE